MHVVYMCGSCAVISVYLVECMYRLTHVIYTCGAVCMHICVNIQYNIQYSTIHITYTCLHFSHLNPPSS